MISRRLREAVLLSSKRQYEIAHQAGLHPSTLSKILNGIERVKVGDPRVLRLGKVLGIPANELFEDDLGHQGEPDSAKGDK